MVRLKENSGPIRSRDGFVVMYTDQQMSKIEGMVYIENYSFDLGGGKETFIFYDDLAVVIDMRDIHKDGNGIDVIWHRFIKVLTNSGKLGWISRKWLERVFER
jgi:hypothetical protein